jgi:hypothetical protein
MTHIKKRNLKENINLSSMNYYPLNQHRNIQQLWMNKLKIDLMISTPQKR